jgi:hypothetical protein
MATTSEHPSGTVIQTWLPHPLDQELRKHAEAERRSLSSTIRLAIEGNLTRADRERRRLDKVLLRHRPLTIPGGGGGTRLDRKKSAAVPLKGAAAARSRGLCDKVLLPCVTDRA